MYGQQQTLITQAMLDHDAKLMQEVSKHNTYYSYKKYNAYQQLNTYWAKQGFLVYSKFRDIPVPEDHKNIKVLNKTSLLLSPDIKQVYLHSDSVVYQKDLLLYSAMRQDKHFAMIEFAILAKVNQAFKQVKDQIESTAWHSSYKMQANGTQITMAW